MSQSDLVVGIDLGTTNSAIAVVRDGKPVLIPVDGFPLLPSVVGLDPNGQLLVGYPARNQAILYPERTVRSIKRRMGESSEITLGDRKFTPVEISAIILRHLKHAAEAYLKVPVTRAVITVPAYFSDVQRVATREAGEIAGFTVERILHEPTAAALCYIAAESPHDSTFLVYDLGGGTFDVSIVRTRGDVTEVLASHGDTKLGGDDFDELLQTSLRKTIEEEHGISLENNRRALSRLSRAAENAKIALSTESYVSVIEENIADKDGIGIHLNKELARPDYEEMIYPLLQKTRTSIQTALREAKLLLRDVDDILLVGGSTRTPLVSSLIQEEMKKVPRQDINPDTAVVLGAALQAARIMGENAQILVDASPFSFGTSYLGLMHGYPSPDCYKAIIQRNTALPTRQTHIFYTIQEGQEAIEVKIFQGENEDATENLLIGKFLVEGLSRSAPAQSPILFDLKLDLDGILEVAVTEKRSGLRKEVTIQDAFRKMSPEDLAQAKERISSLFGGDIFDVISNEESNETAATSEDAAFLLPPMEMLSPDQQKAWQKTQTLIQKAVNMLDELEEVDRNEVADLLQSLQQAMANGELQRVEDIRRELTDVLFYLE